MRTCMPVGPVTSNYTPLSTYILLPLACRSLPWLLMCCSLNTAAWVEMKRRVGACRQCMRGWGRQAHSPLCTLTHTRTCCARCAVRVFWGGEGSRLSRMLCSAGCACSSCSAGCACLAAGCLFGLFGLFGLFSCRLVRLVQLVQLVRPACLVCMRVIQLAVLVRCSIAGDWLEICTAVQP